jgi:hypothetical protein
LLNVTVGVRPMQGQGSSVTNAPATASLKSV